MIELLIGTLLATGAADGGSSTAEPTRFAVEVSKTGQTQVTAHSGLPVRVDAAGNEQVLQPGQSAQFDVEKTPEKPIKPFDVTVAPKLISPNPDERLRFKLLSENLLGPVKLSWRAVDSATGYEIEVRKSNSSNAPLTLKVDRPRAQLPPMEEGRYSWSVRAVAASGEVGSTSPSRSFLLTKDSVRLDVQSTDWK